MYRSIRCYIHQCIRCRAQHYLCLEFREWTNINSNKSPAVTYSTAGTFTVSLTVTNTTTGCVNTLQMTLSSPILQLELMLQLRAVLEIQYHHLINPPSARINGIGTLETSNFNFSKSKCCLHNCWNLHFPCFRKTQSLDARMLLRKPLPSIHLPTPSFTPSATIGCAPVSLNFTNNSPGGSSYIWNYGDGTTATGFNPGPHVYTANGTYSVTLSMVDANGCSGTTTQIDLITVTAPIVDFTLDEDDGCAPVTVQFSDLSISPNPVSDPIVSWVWDFGDGSPPYMDKFLLRIFINIGRTL